MSKSMSPMTREIVDALGQTQSDPENELTRALSILQSRCGGMERSGRNSHLRSTYSTLKDAWAVIRPHLAELGLSVSQWPIYKDGMAGALTEVEHVCGLGKTCEFLLPVPKGNNQVHQIGSAITYAKRITLVAACGLAEDEHDDDGNAAGQTQSPTASATGQHRPVRDSRPASAVASGGHPPTQKQLDDTRDAILALVPKLPIREQANAKKNAKGAHDCGDLQYLKSMLAWVEGKVLPKEVEA